MENVKISNTNGNSRQRSCVRVYVNKTLICELFVNKHNPLKYLGTLKSSKYYDQLCGDLYLAMNSGLCTLTQSQYIKQYIFEGI